MLGNVIQHYFDEHDMGDIDAVAGSLDGTPYKIWCMKEPDYVRRMTATMVALLADENCKEKEELDRRWCRKVRKIQVSQAI